MSAVSDHVFSVFVDAACDRLKDPKINSCTDNTVRTCRRDVPKEMEHEDKLISVETRTVISNFHLISAIPSNILHHHQISLAKPAMQSLQQLRSVVSQVFEYFIAHCTHKLVLVRTTALRFSGRMLDRFPWLLSDYSGEEEGGCVSL
jgi:hypothetical protein